MSAMGRKLPLALGPPHLQQSGQTTLCGVRVASMTVICSSRESRCSASLESASCTIHGFSWYRACSEYLLALNARPSGPSAECATPPLHLVYVKQGLMPLKVRAFIDWMAPRLKQELSELNESRPTS